MEGPILHEQSVTKGKNRANMKKYLIISVVAVVLIGAGYMLQNGSDAEAETTIGQVTRIEQIARGDLNLVVSANGVVQPINKVEIKSKASGQIVELKFIEGQYVNKGELLLALDPRTTKNDLEQARADLAVAEANLKQAKNNNTRAKELYEKNLVSVQEKDQANLEYVRAQSQVVKARAATASAEERLADTRIIAPISGVILTKNIELGMIISSGVSNVGGGTLLGTIADMNEVYVETNVDEVDIGKVREGQEATVIADAYPEDRFTGQVERISPLGKTQQNVTTFNVITLVRNRDDKLKAGMSTSVDIEIFNQRNVVLVPNEALRDPKSEQGLQIMEANNLSIPADTSEMASQGGRRRAFGESAGGDMRARFQNMSDEERQKMREQFRQRLQNMSAEERQQMAQRFGGGRASGTDGENAFVRRRPVQRQDENEVRWRLVKSRDGDEFRPKLIKVGVSNFDYSVVVEGLKEGDEIEVTTISRAKLASEQFNQRMRGMSPLGGMSGGNAARQATGGGGRR